MKQSIFALIDCNNFFVSCERLFRPDLEGKPVVVLSSNDGCVIARSNEAKALGIAMAAPAFKFLHTLRDHDVVQFSANFELYGNVSSRITSLLSSITPHIEVYSVDESFLDPSELDIRDYTEWAAMVRDQVFRYVGVPVSIGIATSKTLAKLAAERAKKTPELGGVLSFIDRNPKTPKPSFQRRLESSRKVNQYLSLDSSLRSSSLSDLRADGWNDSAYDKALAQTPIQDVWGVGWRLTPKLKAEGIHTALGMRQFSPKRASQLMGVRGRQLVAELNGTTCFPLQRYHKPQQQIMRGRQFGEDTNQFHVIEAAVASLTARATAHLRHEQRLARQAAVIIRTNRNTSIEPSRWTASPGYHKISQTVTFATPTADTGTICAALVDALQDIINPQDLYHKADVMLFNLISQESLQTDLLGAVNPAAHDRETARMQAIDSLNKRYGKNHLHYAAEDLSQAWRPRHNLGSPRYTSSWAELPVVHAVETL